MRYKVTEYGDIRENYIVPFSINWKTLLVHLFIWAPGLITLYYTCFKYGWDNYEDGVKISATTISNFAILLLSFAVLISAFYTGITEKFPISFKKYKSYSITYFNKGHLDIPIYKEAYKECIQDIKNDNFDRTEWNVIFRNLSSEADRLKEGEKQIKKINIPKRDFAGELKDSNDMYLRGIK